jgi:hypothetical protein
VTTTMNASLASAIEDFLATHKAAHEARSNLTRAQSCGPDPVPTEVEYLVGEAQHCWDLLATGWAESLLPKQVREAGAEYLRPKVLHAPVAQSGPVDWARGR